VFLIGDKRFLEFPYTELGFSFKGIFDSAQFSVLTQAKESLITLCFMLLSAFQDCEKFHKVKAF
jgi:hypothetical protein